VDVANFIAPAQISRSEHAVRLGVSYHFGGPAGPIVAKY